MRTLGRFVVALALAVSGCAAQEPYAEPCAYRGEVRWCSCDDRWEWVSTRQCTQMSPPVWDACDCGNARRVGPAQDRRDAGSTMPYDFFGGDAGR